MRFLSKLLLEHCKNKRLTNSVSAATAQQRPKSSLLTDEEQDAQYRAVINAARQNADVSSGLNSVSLLLMQQYVMHLHKAADQVHCPQPATACIYPACFAWATVRGPLALPVEMHQHGVLGKGLVGEQGRGGRFVTACFSTPAWDKHQHCQWHKHWVINAECVFGQIGC